MFVLRIASTYYVETSSFPLTKSTHSYGATVGHPTTTRDVLSTAIHGIQSSWMGESRKRDANGDVL